MRTMDLSPLFRSTVGFDHLTRLIDNVQRVDEQTFAYPPYNIEKLSDDAYRITMAVAGFGRDDLTIKQDRNMLMVTGEKTGADNAQYLHRAIAGRSFQRCFELADHVKVIGANLVNGLLTIDLNREVPEEMKPRKIEIATGTALPGAETKRIETKKQAA